MLLLFLPLVYSMMSVLYLASVAIGMMEPQDWPRLFGFASTQCGSAGGELTHFS